MLPQQSTKNCCSLKCKVSKKNSLLPSVRREMSTGQSAVMLCGSEWRQDGSFHSWMNVWVAGKAVWSLVNTCHPKHFRDEFHNEANLHCVLSRSRGRPSVISLNSRHCQLVFNHLPLPWTTYSRHSILSSGTFIRLFTGSKADMWLRLAIDPMVWSAQVGHVNNSRLVSV